MAWDNLERQHEYNQANWRRWKKSPEKNRAAVRKSQLKHREDVLSRRRAWYQEHQVQVRAEQKERMGRYKQEALAHYGAVCACCGETNPFFLTFDHINNDGAECRKKYGKHAMARWVVMNNYPDTIQVLCFNCNCGKSINHGICPHKSVAQ